MVVHLGHDGPQVHLPGGVGLHDEHGGQPVLQHVGPHLCSTRVSARLSERRREQTERGEKRGRGRTDVGVGAPAGNDAHLLHLLGHGRQADQAQVAVVDAREGGQVDAGQVGLQQHGVAAVGAVGQVEVLDGVEAQGAVAGGGAAARSRPRRRTRRTRTRRRSCRARRTTRPSTTPAGAPTRPAPATATGDREPASWGGSSGGPAGRVELVGSAERSAAGRERGRRGGDECLSDLAVRAPSKWGRRRRRRRRRRREKLREKARGRRLKQKTGNGAARQGKSERWWGERRGVSGESSRQGRK